MNERIKPNTPDLVSSVNRINEARKASMQSAPDMEKNRKIEEARSEALQHAKNNKRSAEAGAKCVDGGYKPNEAAGRLARPGGHLGVSMALLELGYTPQQAFDTVFDFVVSRGEKYGWHSDTHADPENEGEEHAHHDKPKVGCGHCNVAIGKPERYSNTVTSEQFNELLMIVRQAQADPEKSKHMEFINLDRKHKEEHILAILDEEMTVDPWDLQADTMYFIYDMARDKKLFSDLVYYMAEAGVIGDEERSTTFEKLWNEDESSQGAVQRQTGATLGSLETSKGKFIFGVSWVGGVPEIKYVGDAPVIN